MGRPDPPAPSGPSQGNTRPAIVGIIANPAAGKDIRRLVAQGTTFDNQTKVSVIRRVLAGLGTLGVDRILLMPDTHRLAQRAAEGASRQSATSASCEIIDLPVTGEAADSETAARLMRQAGARCIVVLGGDGTVRVVSHGSGDVPLLPISTGTNNVLPTFVEGTVAGLAAGAIARGELPPGRGVYRQKRLVLCAAGDEVTDALVDVALFAGRFVGSRAVWDVSRLRQAAVTRAAPTDIGISALVGAAQPVSPLEPFGIAFTVAAEGRCRVTAAVAPGVVADVGIGSWHRLGVGESVAVVDERPLVVAVDGEREAVLHRHETANISLRADGPYIVDVKRVMAELVAQGRFSMRSGVDQPVA